MKRRLRVGIAGYGVVGRVRHEAAERNDLFEVVAVSDKQLAGRTHTDSGVRCYGDYEHLVDGEDLDVLFACLPNYLAADATCAGLYAGCHVFCEKPPGRDVQDIRRVIDVERAHPELKLMYGFNHRYHRSVQQALEIIEGGELGRVIDLRGVYGKSKIISFQSDWRTKREFAGGGILLDQGIHLLDMLRLFAGEFTEVHSFISNRYWKHNVEDNAYALLRTEDGVVAMVHSSATQWRHRFKLDVTLEKGAIVLEGLLTNSKSYAPETISVIYSEDESRGEPRETRWLISEDSSFQLEIDEFARCIRGDAPIRSGSSDHALKTMELVYRVYWADEEWSGQFGLKRPDGQER